MIFSVSGDVGRLLLYGRVHFLGCTTASASAVAAAAVGAGASATDASFSFCSSHRRFFLSAASFVVTSRQVLVFFLSYTSLSFSSPLCAEFSLKCNTRIEYSVHVLCVYWLLHCTTAVAVFAAER